MCDDGAAQPVVSKVALGLMRRGTPNDESGSHNNDRELLRHGGWECSRLLPFLRKSNMLR